MKYEKKNRIQLKSSKSYYLLSLSIRKYMRLQFNITEASINLCSKPIPACFASKMKSLPNLQLIIPPRRTKSKKRFHSETTGGRTEQIYVTIKPTEGESIRKTFKRIPWFPTRPRRLAESRSTA